MADGNSIGYWQHTAKEAFRIATEAKEQCVVISATQRQHEAVCTERWTEARRAMNEIKSGLTKIFWWMLGIFVTLAGGLGILLVTHLLDGVK